MIIRNRTYTHWNKVVTKNQTNPSQPVTLLVMAKPAVAGRVKTRMCPPLNADQAAALHAAMARCLLQRLETAFILDDSRSPGPVRLVLAINPPATGETARPITPGPAWGVIGQGRGDLGERLAHAWDAAGRGPVIFLGTDSPDLPLDALRQMVAELSGGGGDGAGDGGWDAGAGPVGDGGYWTLACRSHAPGLLSGIDWGSPRVYDQTRRRATDLGLNWRELPRWHDVDTQDDLIALTARLSSLAQTRGGELEPPLAELKQTLDALA